MTLEYADRVRETTLTTGTGTLNLNGPSSGYQGFVAGIGTTNECLYVIDGGAEWEVGRGVVTDAATDTLSRVTVYSSSNAGALVSFSAGNKVVMAVAPAKAIEYGFIAGAHLQAAGGTSIVTSTLTALDYDTLGFETEAGLTAAVTTQRITFPATWAGLYAQAGVNALFAAANACDIHLELEWLSVADAQKGIWYSAARAPAALTPGALYVQSPPMLIVSGDYLLTRAEQDSGSNKTVTGEFWAKSWGIL